MTDLILGPLLRHVGPTDATVWVETDAACEVEVLGCSSPTFRVGYHHYALIHVTGLEPGEAREYEVRLEGERSWPESGFSLPAQRDPSHEEWGDAETGLRLVPHLGTARVPLHPEPR